jgi:hypothetical protein
MRAILTLILSAGMSAQSLHILPSPHSSADASFRILLASPPEKAPVALQWDLSLPRGVSFKRVVAGQSAASAQKTVTCSPLAAEAKEATASRYRCVLVGGQSPVPEGPLATVTYTLSQELREATIRLTKVISVAQDMKQVNLEDSQITVTRD